MPLIFAKQAFTDGNTLKNCLIEVEGGRIRTLSPSVDIQTIPDATIRVDCLAPGFIDIQVNGGEQFHFTHTPRREALIDIAKASRDSGTPFMLPTCVTSSPENIGNAIEATRAFMKEFPHSGVLGMHLEGPFISPQKRGAHLEKYIIRPEGKLMDLLEEDGGQVVKLLTFAPERLTADQLARLQGFGIVLSAGHSNATYKEAMEAFNQGVNVCTHLYNAMSPLGHRNPGLVGAVFDAEQVYAPIILDGLHCDFAAARIAYRQKGRKLLLISDALFLGRKKNSFLWEEFDAKLVGNTYVNSEGNLAGGALSLAETLVNAVEKVGIPLGEAIDMVTRRPAEVLRMENRLGRLAPNYPAVFTTFDEKLKNFKTVSLEN